MIEFISKESDKLLKVVSNETKLNYNVLSRKLKDKQILVDGKRVSENINVEIGQKIVLFAQEKTFQTIYEDDNILVVLKPRGILSISENKSETSVSQILNKKQKLYICHRLDVNTEGLLCFAKSREIFEQIKNCFSAGEVNKTYYAEVFGRVNFDKKTIVCYLEKNAKTATVTVSDSKNKNAIKTETVVEKVKQNGEITLLKIGILDGKTHQIRVALSSEQLYIVGDDKYGNYKLNKKYKVFKQQLFATEIKFNTNSKLKYLNDIAIKYTPKFKFSSI